MDMGAVTESYKADRKQVIKILNEVLASGIHAQSVAAEFLEHANEEMAHADIAATRITQLPISTPTASPDAAIPNLPKATRCSTWCRRT